MQIQKGYRKTNITIKRQESQKINIRSWLIYINAKYMLSK